MPKAGSGSVRMMKYDAARSALAEAHKVDEVKAIHDKATAVREYARRAKDGELLAMATEIKVWAERRAGELLSEISKPGPGPGRSKKNQSSPSERFSLKPFGITPNQSSAWQRLAAVPEAEFTRHLRAADLAALTTRKLLGALMVTARRAANQGVKPASGASAEDLDALVRRGETFGTIYADPPWLYDNQGTRAATGNHYSGMTVDDVCALPIEKLAAASAHLHLWTTNGFLFDAPRIFAAWGFEFRSSFVWVKKQMGIGNYWRNSHELLLTAIRGDAKRFADKTLKSWIEVGRGRHSSKPDQVREMLERASPAPRLELFGRRRVDGWTVWGDEVELV